MAITAFKRYEQKFMLKQSQFDALLPKLLKYMEPDKNCRNGKEYIIYNIYYDTCNNDIIEHSLSKPYYKEKLRLRSYSIPTSSNYMNEQVVREIEYFLNCNDVKPATYISYNRMAFFGKDIYKFVLASLNVENSLVLILFNK